MAWTFQAIGTPVFTSDVSTPFNASPDAGDTAGDILLAYAAQRCNAVPGAWATPSGWTLLYTEDAFGGYDQAAVFGKVSAGDVAATAFSNPANFAGGAVIARYRGGQVIAPHAADKQGSSGIADIDAPALVISTPNTLVLYLARNNIPNSPTCTFPSGVTSRLAVANAANISLFWGDSIQTAAANRSSGTIDRSDSTTATSAVMVVSLLPVAVTNKAPLHLLMG